MYTNKHNYIFLGFRSEFPKINWVQPNPRITISKFWISIIFRSFLQKKFWIMTISWFSEGFPPVCAVAPLFNKISMCLRCVFGLVFGTLSERESNKPNYAVVYWKSYYKLLVNNTSVVVHYICKEYTLHLFLTCFVVGL